MIFTTIFRGIMTNMLWSAMNEYPPLKYVRQDNNGKSIDLYVKLDCCSGKEASGLCFLTRVLYIQRGVGYQRPFFFVDNLEGINYSYV